MSGIEMIWYLDDRPITRPIVRKGLINRLKISVHGCMLWTTEIMPNILCRKNFASWFLSPFQTRSGPGLFKLTNSHLSWLLFVKIAFKELDIVDVTVLVFVGQLWLYAPCQLLLHLLHEQRVRLQRAERSGRQSEKMQVILKFNKTGLDQFCGVHKVVWFYVKM